MFGIRWQKSVSRKLLDECSKADSSRLSAILDAIAQVESTLHDGPELVGKSRESDKRIVVVEPLSITYKIDHRQRTIHIIGARVRRTKR